jgi:hypothetical protein
MIKRHKKINIPLEIIESFGKCVGDPVNLEEDCISQIWIKVFNKYDKSNLRLTGGRDVAQVRDLFEEYFINGLSEGACVGQAMNELSTRYKYIKRERNRLGALFLHLNPGVGKTYSRFGNRFKVSRQNLQDLVGKLSNLPLSSLLFSGKPWLNEVEKHSYLLEISDHYYFFDIIQRYVKNSVLKPVFIGDGSGILSNMLLTSDIDLCDATFIDLQHFLIRQYIVNFNEQSKIQKFVYAQDFDATEVDGQGMTIINQDSFPEIPSEALKSYFKLIKFNKVDRVISYNHLDLRGHSNYRVLLVEYFGEPVVRFESIIRSGYFIEIFER